MQLFENYAVTISVVVFALFVIVFAFLIGSIFFLTLRLIKSGAMDDRIDHEFLTEDYKRQKAKRGVCRVISSVFSLILIVFFSASFLVALATNREPSTMVGDIPMPKIILTSSMAKKYNSNKYLYDNKLDNQLQVNDLVLIRKLPEEEELKLYDIVVYEIEGELVIHRIVGILEPDETHPERRYRLQGDNMRNPDFLLVKYSQMRGIYRDEKIPFIGSFFLFMRTIGGYLCLALVATATIISPIIDQILKKARLRRWYRM